MKPDITNNKSVLFPRFPKNQSPYRTWPATSISSPHRERRRAASARCRWLHTQHPLLDPLKTRSTRRRTAGWSLATNTTFPSTGVPPHLTSQRQRHVLNRSTVLVQGLCQCLWNLRSMLQRAPNHRATRMQLARAAAMAVLVSLEEQQIVCWVTILWGRLWVQEAWAR